MKLDKIGIWSEIKIEIVKDYASAYTKILSKKDWCKGYVYIDAFSGAGIHISKTTGEFIEGSPLNALNIIPPFTEYHFIDLDKEKIKLLEKIAKENPNVHLHNGDCNEILTEIIFSTLTYDTFKRALCFLDPYGLHLKWESIKMAADLKTIDIFLNFPIMDMHRNVLFEDLSTADPEDIRRMNAFWGDETWRDVLYAKQQDLFGNTHSLKIDNFKTLAHKFRNRLKNKAGFKEVPEPILMTNSRNGPLYYLYFASQQNVASKIVKDIFNKYRRSI